MSVAQKLGRSGAGQENYDTETGRYIDTVTINDVKPKQQPQKENKDPSRYEDSNYKGPQIVKPHFKNVLQNESQPQEEDDYAERLEEFKKQNPEATSMDFLKQTDPEKYEQAMKQSEKFGNLPTEEYQQDDAYKSRYYIKQTQDFCKANGVPYDMAKDINLGTLKKLAYYSNYAKVPVDSMVAAYKNYSLNKETYGRSAFMSMMKRQIAERDRKDNVNRSSYEYNKYMTGLGKKNADVIKRYNDKYVKVKNQAILEQKGIPQQRQEIINQKAKLTKTMSKYNQTKDPELKAQIKQLQDSIMLGEKKLANKQKKVSPMLIPDVKNVQQINSMFEQDPVNTTKLLKSIYEDVEREEEKKRKEQEQASKLLGVKI